MDSIVDPEDMVCIGFFAIRKETMELLIETPALEIRKKLEKKRAFTEEDLDGIVLKEVININPSALGIRVIFRTPNNVPEEIELINSDFRLLHLFIN